MRIKFYHHLVKIFALYFICANTFPISAFADSTWPFYELTCSRELGYFSIKSVSFSDAGDLIRDETGSAKALYGNESARKAFTPLEQSGLFTADSLQRKPYTCHSEADDEDDPNAAKLFGPYIALDVRVEGAFSGTPDIPCGDPRDPMQEHAKVIVNGIDVGTLSTCNGGSQTTSIKATVDTGGRHLTIDRCDLPYLARGAKNGEERAVQGTCRRWSVYSRDLRKKAG